MGYALSTSFPVMASNLVLQLKLTDKALSECITAQAKKYDWKVIKDVHTLKCHGMGNWVSPVSRVIIVIRSVATAPSPANKGGHLPAQVSVSSGVPIQVEVSIESLSKV